MRNLELPGRSPVHAMKAMAATSHTLSTQAAVDIMRRGGNAMDAAIAACAVQCVVEPGSTGIGGDCFCLYAPAGAAEPIAYNGSGKAPTGATPAYYESQGMAELPRQSPHSVVVPGAAEAWCRLNADHGKLPLAEVLAPAVAYARGGYPISSRVSQDWAGAVG
ncbi:MAG: gamma-glutamyltransferase, partial [Pseudomonadota bacterium]